LNGTASHNVNFKVNRINKLKNKSVGGGERTVGPGEDDAAGGRKEEE
jgi:hypothetical protein